MSTGLTTPPDEQGLQALLKEAYEQLPSPDTWRLKDIEERLSRQLARAPRPDRKPSLWPWWLAATLVAASAAAAWWLYEAASERAGAERVLPATYDTPPKERVAPETQAQEEGSDDVRGERGTADVPADRKGPVIYQRETY